MSDIASVLHALHARISRLDSAFVALARAGGLPEGFTAAFTDDIQKQVAGLQGQPGLDEYKLVTQQWVELFQKLEKKVA